MCPDVPVAGCTLPRIGGKLLQLEASLLLLDQSLLVALWWAFALALLFFTGSFLRRRRTAGGTLRQNHNSEEGWRRQGGRSQCSRRLLDAVAALLNAALTVFCLHRRGQVGKLGLPGRSALLGCLEQAEQLAFAAFEGRRWLPTKPSAPHGAVYHV